jgi:hypothetical protein
LTAVALDADGNALEGRAIEWTTDAASVATVSATGLVQAVASGYADIRATIEGKSSTMTVTVTTPEPAEQFDIVYERRAFNGLGEIRRLSLSTGASTTLPLVVTIPGAYVRDRVFVESRESDVGYLYYEAGRYGAGSTHDWCGFPFAPTLVAVGRGGRGRAVDLDGVGSTGSESFEFEISRIKGSEPLNSRSLRIKARGIQGL